MKSEVAELTPLAGCSWELRDMDLARLSSPGRRKSRPRWMPETIESTQSYLLYVFSVIQMYDSVKLTN